MSKRIRVGVIGLGMGHNHVKGFQAHPGCEVVALCDLNPQRLTEIGDKYGVAARYPDPAQLLERTDLDAVSIAVPNKFHHPLVLAACARGLHVLCEKPMAMNVAQAQEMKAAADAAGKVLMINFSFRFNNMSYALKQQVDAGVIGPVYFGRTVWHRRRGVPGLGGWFTDKELAGGGPLIDLAVHRIDLALWLMGHPEPAGVSGATYNVLARGQALHQKKAFTVEDLACGLVKFTNGATLIVEASWALNINEPEHMVTALYGEKGGIVQKNVGGAYDFAAEIYSEEGGNLYTKRLDSAVTPAPTSYEEFINAIREERPPLATAEHGIKVQKIIDGLYASAALGHEIVFHPPIPAPVPAAIPASIRPFPI